jgi:outer membrane protein, heavy metal efflux system
MSARQAGCYWLLMFVGLLTDFRAEAQDLELSLAGALQQAVTSNAEIGVAQAQAELARGQVQQAGLRPNPRMLVQTEDIRPGTTQAPFSFVDSTEDYLTVGQTIEVSGKRRKRVELAKANLGESELQVELTRRQLLLRVGAAYWSAVLSDRVAHQTEETLQTYEEDVRYLEARVREGVAAESDAVRIRVERDRVRLMLMQAQRDREQNVVALLRAMGRSEFPNIRLTTPLEASQPPKLFAAEDVVGARLEVQIAQRAITAANSNLRLQRATAKPDPEIFVGYKRNTGFDTAYAAVQVDLPVSNRNQGNVSSALAQVRREEENLRFVQNSVRAEYEGALRYYRDQQKMAQSLPNVLARARESERQARAAYREGGLELLRLLDVQRSRIEVETEYSRALADLQRSLLMVRAAAGAELTGGFGL